jgi:uncharacterized protein with von Willebrand factor type A (vWA) domain
MTEQRSADPSAETIHAALSESVREHVITAVVTLESDLRAENVTVPPNAGLTAVRALSTIGVSDRTRVHHALRSALISRAADLPVFEAVFREFWARLTMSSDGMAESEPTSNAPDRALQAEPSHSEATDGPDEVDALAGTTSRSQLSGPLDGAADDDGLASTATYTPTGTSEGLVADSEAIDEGSFREPIARLGRVLGQVDGRRSVPDSTGASVDIRRALRRIAGTGGAMLEPPRIDFDRTAMDTVVLVDVSRSVLDTLDRSALLEMCRQMHASWRSVRTFFFDTEIAEVSAHLAEPSPERAVDALVGAETAWGGGTQIGRSLATLRRTHPYAVDRETIVFIVSDGLEVGELDLLDREMVTLSTAAAGVLWLNPLATAPSYEPTCQGMATARQSLDGLFAFGEPGDLDEVARQVSQRGLTGAIGYKYDGRGYSRETTETVGRSEQV